MMGVLRPEGILLHPWPWGERGEWARSRFYACALGCARSHCLVLLDPLQTVVMFYHSGRKALRKRPRI